MFSTLGSCQQAESYDIRGFKLLPKIRFAITLIMLISQQTDTLSNCGYLVSRMNMENENNNKKIMQHKCKF